MRIAILLVIAVFSFSISWGQTKISGVVKGSNDGLVLPGVNITVKDKTTEEVLAYAIANENGLYLLNFKTVADSVLITVSGFNRKKQFTVYSNKSQVLNFNLAPEVIKLQEVIIKPPRIRKLGDTLNYLVDAFTDKNDRTIGDVLRKMPGLEISADGTISYFKKPINKFYIEGLDMLQGRYNVATNNIEAKDVATVQVLENHQPIKALKDREFVEASAINLKLKDHAKGAFSANAQLGLGAAPLLYNNELFGMYFNKDRQFIASYKGNNTGDDSARELKNFYAEDRNLNLPLSLAIQEPAGPGVDRKRYLLNRDHAVSVNNLWALAKDYKLTANLSYLNDRQEKSSYSRSDEYFSGDSILTIEERLSAVEKFHYLDGQVQLNVNKDSYYLDNALKFSGEFRDAYGTVVNTQKVFQDRNVPYGKISNTFSLIKNYKKTNFKINSYNGYIRQPERLDIQPLLYPSLFNNAGQISAMQQSLTQQLLASYSSLNFGINHGAWKQNYILGLNATLQQLETSLNGKTASGNLLETADSLKNDLQWRNLNLYFSPTYTYKKDDFSASADLPVSYTSFNSNDRLRTVDRQFNKFFFNPSFYANYKMGLFWSLSARASSKNSIGGIEDAYRGYIMQSYRNLVRNEGELPESQYQSVNVNAYYSQPVHEIFIGLGASYYRNRTNLSYGNDFLGILSIRRTYDLPNVSNGVGLNGNISKGLQGLLSKISLNAGYNNSENTQIRQEVVLNYSSQTYNIGAGAHGKIGEWSAFKYSLEFSESRSKVENSIAALKPVRSLTQQGKLDFFPASGLIVNLSYQFQYNNAVSGSGRTMNFADAGIKYRFKKLDFNLECNNIFNVKQYISALNNGISSYYAAYDLRPLQVLLKLRFKIK